MIAVAGQIVWIPVTDHPRCPRVCYVGQIGVGQSAYIYATREECQRICDAWNVGRHIGDWLYYPLEVCVQACDA